MNWVRATVCLAIGMLLLSTLVAAEQKPQLNKYGVLDKYTVNFTDPVRVGDTLLPKGDYEITHTMKGEEHIMVFRQLGAEKPIEVSATCVLVKLSAPAIQTQKNYILNDANERVLKGMVFKGDTAKHVF
jgi:acyl dehydratase